MGPFVNPFIAACGLLQLIGSGHSFFAGNWRMGVINAAVGVANIVLSTLKG